VGLAGKPSFCSAVTMNVWIGPNQGSGSRFIASSTGTLRFYGVETKNRHLNLGRRLRFWGHVDRFDNSRHLRDFTWPRTLSISENDGKVR
jgi:hypothetical protein